MSHAEFLRDHHDGPRDDVVALIRALYDAGERAAAVGVEEGLDLIGEALDQALEGSSLAGHRALLDVVVRLALAPRSMRAGRWEALRAQGYSDREIHDVVHVVACFSYMNRLADGLGVEAIADRDAWAVELLGETRLKAHRAWARGE